jgi:hypothetical protein
MCDVIGEYLVKEYGINKTLFAITDKTVKAKKGPPAQDSKR